MIYMEIGPSTVVGISLSLISIFLYFIKTSNPKVSRDYDIFFSSVGLLCGGILIFQGWRLDPILLLCQILLSGTTIFFIAESLWLRTNKITLTSKFSNFFVNTQNLFKSNHNILYNKNTNLVNLKNSHKWYINRKLLVVHKYVINWFSIDYTGPIDY
uniref:Hypothetical chloroplast RF66 n=1 Tax=Cylindrocystis brebissonii TaxID=102167 RepID=A0A191T6A7_9VIRI|nr:hypothetical chloroplast RF66 [Cylindrocystis brebissonii]ANI25907.1 hypothetical chloroplast RF66 [Cylindrocystis brebissonii]